MHAYINIRRPLIHKFVVVALHFNRAQSMLHSFRWSFKGSELYSDLECSWC